MGFLEDDGEGISSQYGSFAFRKEQASSSRCAGGERTTFFVDNKYSGHVVSLEASDQVLTSKEAIPSRKVCLDNVIIACHATCTEHPPKSLFNTVAIELQAGTHP